MEDQDKIIVLKSFNNPIDASIAKSKLDAYGIPCFLSDENLGTLYPVQNPRFIGVRLHLFERDADQAKQVLHDTVMYTEDDALCCPRCRSANIEVTNARQVSSRVLNFLKSLTASIFLKRKIYVCKDCHFEFQA
jgi:uncharacterized protein with PIN domain